MNDLMTIPTVEQINLEHQLANSKANEAVQHATNCGLMLLQVKASKQHGEWLPWLNGEIESGRLKVGERQARRYMQVASNRTRESNLLEAPSIRAALELLSDKEPDEQQGTLIDVEAERQAREAAEAKAEAERQAREQAEADLETERQRGDEWRVQALKDREEKRAAEQKVLALESRPAPKPATIEKIVAPADYETAKQQAAQLKDDLAKLRKKQDELVQQQVVAKLREREKELADLERKAKDAETLLQSLNKQISNYSSIERMTRLQRDQIEKSRSMLAELAANLEGFDRLENDPKTDQLWAALADMLRNGAMAIDFFRGATTPAFPEAT